MRALICGGRDVGNASAITDATSPVTGLNIMGASRVIRFVNNKLDELNATMQFSCIICGSENGAERLGRHWAEMRGIPLEAFKRKKGMFFSETHGERNQRMLRDGAPELCIAFGGGEGTEALLSQAAKMNIKVVRFDVP